MSSAALNVPPGTKLIRGFGACGICNASYKCCETKTVCKVCRFECCQQCMGQTGECFFCALIAKADPHKLPERKGKYIVIGASMTGAFFALAMAKKGFEVEVYEKNDGPGTWRGIINMHQVAIQCFRELGIEEQIEGRKAVTAAFKNLEGDIITTADMKKDGRRYNLPEYMYTCDRSRLLEQFRELAIAAGAKIHLGKKVTSITQDEGENGSVKVSFEDGSTAEGDFMIAADGVHSFTRNTIFAKLGGDKQPESTKHWCANGICESDDIPAAFTEYDQVEYWGKNGVIGFFPFNEKTLFWFCLQEGTRPAHPKDMPRAEYSKLVLDKVKADFGSYHKDLPGVLQNSDSSFTGAFELPSVGKDLKTWDKGRILMLGDACHAMCNRLGSGGGTGIEDALAASQLIEFHMRAAQADDKSKEFKAVRAAFKDTFRRRYWRGMSIQEMSMTVAEISVVKADAGCGLGKLFQSIMRMSGSASEEKRSAGSMDFIHNCRVCASTTLAVERNMTTPNL